MKLSNLHEAKSASFDRMVEIAANLLRNKTPFSQAIHKAISQMGITDRTDIGRLSREIGNELKKRSVIKRQSIARNKKKAQELSELPPQGFLF